MPRTAAILDVPGHTLRPAACLLLALTLAACAGPGPMVAGEADLLPNPATVPANRYDAAFEAAQQTLRDHRFVIDLNSYRLGRITTDPRPVPLLFEVWDPTQTTAAHAVTATLNAQRRTARVMLEPTPEVPPEAPPEVAPDAPSAVTPEAPAEYQLRVEVILEQRQTPTRRLSGTMVGQRLFRPLTALPGEWAQRGIGRSYWRPIARDPILEQRLLRDILESLEHQEAPLRDSR